MVLYLLLLFLLIILSKNNFHIYLISNEYEVTLKIKGQGIKKFIYSSFTCPSEVYLNGEIQNLRNCFELNVIETESQIKLIWNDIIYSAYRMFCECGDITEIDLTHFDTSLVNNMNSMFQNCVSLTSINISNLDTRNVLQMDVMFNSCYLLKSIDLSSFDTSSVTTLGYMFYDCRSLTSINLNNFNTQNVQDIKFMFYNNYELTSVDLSNFNTQNIYTMENLFYNCYKLEYINIINFEETRNPSISYMFFNIPNNVNICLDSNKSPNIYNTARNITCVTFSCDTTWKSLQKKYIENTGECVKECNETIYKYEYQGKCYGLCNEIERNNNNKCYSCDSNCKTCSFDISIFTNSNCTSCEENKFLSDGKCLDIIIPSTTNVVQIAKTSLDIIIPNSKNYVEVSEIVEFIDNVPLKKCSKENPFEMVENTTCVNNCTIMERLNGLCIINYESKDNEENKEIEEKAINNIKREMKNLNTSYIDNGEDIMIKQKYSTITISSTKNQRNQKSYNKTNIDLCDCEYILKDKYNISYNKSLYILKLDIEREGFQFPIIEYEVYYPLFGTSNIKLNLTSCIDYKINLSIPALLSDNIDKNNARSGYYNDICYTYTSKYGTDISLSDRKNEFIKNNLSLCEENCNFIDYDYLLEKAICSCNVKTNSTFKIRGIEIDVERLYDSFTDFKNIANIKVIKCYKLIFKLDSYKNNYANLILIIIIFFLFVTLIIFCCKDFPNLKKILFMIVYLKTNSKSVQKIINKKSKEEGNKNKNKKQIKNQRNILTNNNNNNNKKKNKIQNKTKQQKKNKIKKQNINSNPVKKRQKSNNHYNNILTINNCTNIRNDDSTLNDINVSFNEKQIYEMAIKINKYTELELNSLPYKDALKNDNRTYCMYYISLIRTKHLLFFSFMPQFDYNSRILKIFLFFFNFTTNFIINALFFNENTMHKIYIEKGTFNFIYNIPQIIYSSVISGLINAIIKILALSYSVFTDMKEINNKNTINIEAKKSITLLKIKFFFFFFASFVFLILFWIYLACFCAVYKNTQIYLIKNTLISFSTSMIYPFGLYIIPGIVRIYALKGKNKECLYEFSKYIQIII